MPPFGRLLGATQTDGPRELHIDLTGVTGRVASIYICRGHGLVEVSLRRAGRTLLWMKTEACNARYIYKGESQPIGQGGDATLTLTVAANVQFSFVLEEILS